MSTATTRRSRTGTLFAVLTMSAVFVPSLLGDGSSRIQAADKSAENPRLIRAAQSGRWSDPATWEGGKLPAAGSRVQVRREHTVRYDVKSDQAIRSIQIAGTLPKNPRGI